MTLAGFRNSVVSSTTGLPVSGATVTVTLAGTSTPATIYRDKNAATPIIDLVTDADGFFEFYAVAGTYDVTVSLGASSVVWNDVAVGTMQSTDYNRVWRVDSGAAEDLDAAISDLAPVVKTAAEWEADTETVLSIGRLGYASDTNVLKVGNGGDLFGDRQAVGGSGDGHAAVTLSSDLTVTITSSRALVSSDCTFGLDGQEIWSGRQRKLDSSGGALDLPLDDSLVPGFELKLFVTNADNPITIKRPTVAVEGTGTTNGTDTVAMADTSPARVGDVVASDVGITSGQTVLSITPNTSVTLSAAADGSVTDETITFTGQRGVFNGSEADVTLRKGPVFIALTGDTEGIDAEILGATNEGLGPVTTEDEDADFTLAGTDLGKRKRLTKSSGTQTVTIPKPSAINAVPGTSVIFKATLAGATTFTLSGTGSPVFVDIAANTLNITVGGSVQLFAVDDDTWDLDGAMVPS